MQVNVMIHFTGGRAFIIKYDTGEGEKSVSIDKQSKGTYTWDLVEKAGLTEAQALQLKSLTILNNNSSGEVRIYDMEIRVPSDETTGINRFGSSSESRIVKYIRNRQIIIERNGQHYNPQGQRL